MLCENFIYTGLSTILSSYHLVLPPVVFLTLTILERCKGSVELLDFTSKVSQQD